MSFTPLPKIFTDSLRGKEPSQPGILELGCGDGCFGRVLADLGLKPWGLDLAPPGRGTVADLVGDALAPPVAARSLDLVVAANLVRHLLPRLDGPGFLIRWLEMLKPGGSLFIFEDEPATQPAGAVHYRDLQEFLRRLLPESRGPLLPLRDFQALCAVSLPDVRWEWGLVRNRHQLDAAAVLGFLGQGTHPAGEPGRLMENISRDGLDPGRYWWARAQATAEGSSA